MTEKPSKKEALAALKKAARAGRIEIGNPAVTSNRTPFVEVFDNRANGYRAGFILSWHEAGHGFGQLTFVVDADGRVHIESEMESRAFVIEQLTQMVDDATIDAD